jgi:hypothetical protein
MARFIFLIFISPLSAMLVGNLAEPALFDSGIFWKKPGWVSFRAGYLDDWVYRQTFKDEFPLDGEEVQQTFMKLSTYAGLLTFNFKKRLDIYGLVGSSRLQIDKEIFTKRALGWGVGAKVVLLKSGNFYFGADLKYFQTYQKPKYFVVESLPYNIVSYYRLKYSEYAAALGFSYKAWIFAPYLNATYIKTCLDPDPPGVLVRLPDVNEKATVPTKSVVGQHKWGMALGLTLVDSAKATLAFEWRTLNQNAIDVNGEIRF